MVVAEVSAGLSAQDKAAASFGSHGRNGSVGELALLLVLEVVALELLLELLNTTSGIYE